MTTSTARVDADSSARGTLRTARSRGALAGPLLILLGIWGAFIPFVGPYFGFGFTPAEPWVFTWGRFWLEILPGIATVVGGVILTGTANRASANLGGGLATAAGAWYVVGVPLWSFILGIPAPVGVPVGGVRQQGIEQISILTGLGAVIVLLAALALGRFSVRGVRDMTAAQRAQDRKNERHAAEPADRRTSPGDEPRPGSENPSGRGRTGENTAGATSAENRGNREP